MVSIYNTTKNTVIAQKGTIADTFVSRMTGLLNRKSLLPDEALIITCCQSIHMLFMRFAIDVIFVDGENRVVGLVERIKPYRFSPIFFRSKSAIEIPEGAIVQSKTEIGDKIQIHQAE